MRDSGVRRVIETQADMNEKSSRGLRKTLKILYMVLFDLKMFVGEDAWPAYQNTQETWAVFVESELRIIRKEYEGGSILPLMENERHLELLRWRIRDLRKTAKKLKAMESR